MTSSTPAALFRHVLGGAFAELAPRVRELRGHDTSATWRGGATIHRGQSPLAALRCLAGLPPVLRDVPTSVVFVRKGDRETWSRDFGGHVMRSSLRARVGLLCKCLGPLEFTFVLSARNGENRWRTRRVRLLGMLPLPAALVLRRALPRARTRRALRIPAEASLPLAGPLIRYQDWLERA